MRRVAIACAAIVLAGCVAPVSKDTVGELSEEGLCVRYGDALRSSAMDQVTILGAELARRGITMGSTENEVALRKVVRVGLSRCSMWASWGSSLRDNRTTTAYGTRIQHVFGMVTGTSRNYVYTENGRITAIQN